MCSIWMFLGYIKDCLVPCLWFSMYALHWHKQRQYIQSCVWLPSLRTKHLNCSSGFNGCTWVYSMYTHTCLELNRHVAMVTGLNDEWKVYGGSSIKLLIPLRGWDQLLGGMQVEVRTLWVESVSVTRLPFRLSVSVSVPAHTQTQEKP